MAISQIDHSQAQQQLQVSTGMPMAPQPNQMMQISSIATTPMAQVVSQSVPMQNMTSVSSVMQTPSVNVQNTQQLQTSVNTTQALYQPVNNLVNPMVGAPQAGQQQAGKLFVQQQVLLQGQQPEQTNAPMHPHQQAFILQRRQRILLQQPSGQAGVATGHWRAASVS